MAINWNDLVDYLNGGVYWNLVENKWFAPLNNPAEFQTVKLAEWGTGLEWDCDADIGSDLIRHMADQQDSVLHRETRKSAA